MNYASGTIVQNYNVNAGRVIQLPCFLDQQEPPDGFRAVIFSEPQIIGGLNPINQTGPEFVANTPSAIQFDLTQLIQQNALSRARCIAVWSELGTSLLSGGTLPTGFDLLFDSGFTMPISANAQFNSKAFACGDFISANPIFALTCDKNSTGLAAAFVVCVANFKLDFSGFEMGAFNAAG